MFSSSSVISDHSTCSHQRNITGHTIIVCPLSLVNIFDRNFFMNSLGCPPSLPIPIGSTLGLKLFSFHKTIQKSILLLQKILYIVLFIMVLCPPSQPSTRHNHHCTCPRVLFPVSTCLNPWLNPPIFTCSVVTFLYQTHWKVCHLLMLSLLKKMILTVLKKRFICIQIMLNFWLQLF